MSRAQTYGSGFVVVMDAYLLWTSGKTHTGHGLRGLLTFTPPCGASHLFSRLGPGEAGSPDRTRTSDQQRAPSDGPEGYGRPQFLAKADLIAVIAGRQADAGLTRNLEILAGDTTDEIDAC